MKAKPLHSSRAHPTGRLRRSPPLGPPPRTASVGTTPMSLRATRPVTRCSGLDASSPTIGSYIFTAEARARAHLHGHRPRRQQRLGHDQQRQHRQDGADSERHPRARGQCQRLEQHRCHRDLYRRPIAVGHRLLSGGDRAEQRRRQSVGHGSCTDKAGNSASATASASTSTRPRPTISASRGPRRQCLRLEQHRCHRELHRH